MGPIVVVLLLALLLAAAVMIYVAYPYRGEETPVHPAVGEVMRRGVRSLPTVDTIEARRGQESHQPDSHQLGANR
jgi:hypothetical protein